MGHSDFLVPFPPSLAYAGRYHSRASVFVSPCAPDAGARPGLLGTGRPYPSMSRWRRRISPVAGRSSGASALFFDPGRTGTVRPLGRPGAAPALIKAKAPASRSISGLNGRASARAVYASPGRSPARTQDWLPLLARLYGAGLSPAGPLRKVSSMLPTSSSSFPSLRWTQDQVAHIRRGARDRGRPSCLLFSGQRGVVGLYKGRWQTRLPPGAMAPG